MKIAFLSKGHRGFGLKFSLLNSLRSKRSIPASAIIAPLSVQYLIEGNKNSQSLSFSIFSRDLRKLLLAATPPESTTWFKLKSINAFFVLYNKQSMAAS